MKKKLFLASLIALCGGLSLASCGASDVSSYMDFLYGEYVLNGGTLSYEKWVEYVKGQQGEIGKHAVTITLEDVEGNVTAYVITYSDRSTITFTVTTNEDGTRTIVTIPDQYGFSPTVTIGDNGNWFIDGSDTGIPLTAVESQEVQYHLNGGTLPEGYESRIFVPYGETLDLPVPTYYGHVFGGWFTGEGVNDKQFTSTDAVFTDLDLYAKWTVGSYTLTLDLDGGSYDGPTTLSYSYGEEYSLPVSVVKAGYVFSGWTLEGEAFESEGVYRYEDITVKALYEAAGEHTIHLNLNGGSYSGSTSITVKTNEGYSLPYEGVSNGELVLVGWFDGEEEWDLSGTYELSEDIWLAAKWEELHGYPLSVDLNGGTVSGTLPSTLTNRQVYSGSKLPVPAKSGYEFLGYYVGGMRLTDAEGEVDNIGVLDSYGLNGIFTIELESTLEGVDTYLVRYLDGSTVSFTVTIVEGVEVIEGVTKDGHTPVVSVADDGNWVVDGVNSGINAENGQESNALVARYVSSSGYSGDYAYFGSYPQTRVTDTLLQKKLMDTPDEDGDGYIEYEGKRYAVINSSLTGRVDYFFEVEPILWKVGTNGELSSSLILDALNYYTSSSDRTIEGATISGNNYRYSSIRAFLNGYDGSDYGVADYTLEGFIDSAFTAEEAAKIVTSTVDNSSSSTDSGTEINPYASANTNDKVYLYSYADANEEFALNGYEGLMHEYSDYAYYIGLRNHSEETGAGYYWLRSPYNFYSYTASCVYSAGAFEFGSWVRNANGVLPVLKITL